MLLIIFILSFRYETLTRVKKFSSLTQKVLYNIINYAINIRSYNWPMCFDVQYYLKN